MPGATPALALIPAMGRPASLLKTAWLEMTLRIPGVGQGRHNIDNGEHHRPPRQIRRTTALSKTAKPSLTAAVMSIFFSLMAGLLEANDPLRSNPSNARKEERGGGSQVV